MLIIEIKPGERITIGPDVELWNKEEFNVKIAIEAPRQIQIVRDSAKVKTPK